MAVCCKMSIMQSKLALVVGHLNAATGSLALPEDLALALREGTVAHVAAGRGQQARLVQGLLQSLFTEIDPALILGCARESGADWRHANGLYVEAVADGSPSVEAWERLVADCT